MSKHLFMTITVVAGVMFLCGCATTKDIEVRRYTEIRDRVDQDMTGGNAGMISGAPQPEDRSGIRKTRKVYVVEVTKTAPGDATGAEGMAEDGAAMSGSASSLETEEGLGREVYDEDLESEDIGLFDFDGDEGRMTAPPASTVSYTVEKDDTLQKISKKFYDSYGKWPKIYEHNKDVIGDPNRIKPGIVIEIPME